MSIESLRRKSEDLEAAIEAYQQFLVAFRKLPEPWAAEVVEELGIEKPIPQDDDQDTTKAARPMGPSAAILRLLAPHPLGLPASEIIDALVDRISTKSMSPRKVMYSALVSLKRRGKILQEPNGHYRLASRNS